MRVRDSMKGENLRREIRNANESSNNKFQLTNRKRGIGVRFFLRALEDWGKIYLTLRALRHC
jgi:hypothetical protein